MNLNKTVLVVSNDPDRFISIANTLTREGCRVHFRSGRDMMTSDGEAANLIISELAQPGLDGLQLCRRIRDGYHAASTLVLLVGDLSTESSIVADGFKCGAAAYVSRPIEADDLSAVCRSLLETQRAILTNNAKTQTGRSVQDGCESVVKQDPPAVAIFDDPELG